MNHAFRHRAFKNEMSGTTPGNYALCNFSFPFKNENSIEQLTTSFLSKNPWRSQGLKDEENRPRQCRRLNGGENPQDKLGG